MEKTFRYIQKLSLLIDAHLSVPNNFNCDARPPSQVLVGRKNMLKFLILFKSAHQYHFYII